MAENEYPKIERKYLAHYIDTSFGSGTVNYVRIGKDLEEYNEELNPDVEITKNILGEQSVNHSGYEVQSEVSPFYAREGEPLFEKLDSIVDERSTGDACKTTVVDVRIKSDGTVEKAYREDAYVIPSSRGGGTDGVQIPFTIYRAGNRVSGNFDLTTKTFTEKTLSDAGE